MKCYKKSRWINIAVTFAIVLLVRIIINKRISWRKFYSIKLIKSENSSILQKRNVFEQTNVVAINFNHRLFILLLSNIIGRWQQRQKSVHWTVLCPSEEWSVQKCDFTCDQSKNTEIVCNSWAVLCKNRWSTRFRIRLNLRQTDGNCWWGLPRKWQRTRTVWSIQSKCFTPFRRLYEVPITNLLLAFMRF